MILQSTSGSIETDIWEKATESNEELRRSLPVEAEELYETELNALVNGMKQLEKRAIPVERVTKVVIRALTSRWPKPRYVVSMEAKLLILFHFFAPTWFSDRIKVWLLKKLGSPR